LHEQDKKIIKPNHHLKNGMSCMKPEGYLRVAEASAIKFNWISLAYLLPSHIHAPQVDLPWPAMVSWFPPIGFALPPYTWLDPAH
jgi:hypothetical protein